MTATREFKRDLPKRKQTGGIRFSARRLRDYIEKTTPPSPDAVSLPTGRYTQRGKGANGESST